jgi:hypothetical protein
MEQKGCFFWTVHRLAQIPLSEIKPEVLFWEEKLVELLIATPNVDKCNRRQTRKAKSYATCYTRNTYPKQILFLLPTTWSKSCSTNYAMNRKKGVKMGMVMAPKTPPKNLNKIYCVKLCLLDLDPLELYTETNNIISTNVY